MPIAPASIDVTSPIPAGAASNASVQNGTGRPATLTFIAPDHVNANVTVTFNLNFGSGANVKTVPASAGVNSASKLFSGQRQCHTCINTTGVSPRVLPGLMPDFLEQHSYLLKLNKPVRSPMAGPLVGTYGFDPTIGLGRLSRLRPEIGDSPQFFSMNLRIET